MDTQQTLQKIDDVMEELPEEIRSFIFDGEFDAVFESLKGTYPENTKLNDVKTKTLQCVLGVVPIKELKVFIEEYTPSPEVADIFKREIQEKIIDEILLIIEVHKEMNGKKPVSETDTTLTRISQSFTTPTTLTPTKRTYTNLPTTTKETSVSTANKPLSEALPLTPTHIDPYRELPDVK